MFESMQVLSLTHKKLLNLAHDWLRTFLPHVIAKVFLDCEGILGAALLAGWLPGDGSCCSMLCTIGEAATR